MRSRAVFAVVCGGAALLLTGLSIWERAVPPPSPAVEEPTFARLIETLSEPAGYFDTDNLISNETSYLQVSDLLSERVPAGGAYVGVGPDQNFTYIARTRPQWAFIVDIRRQNLLELLLFNAIFAEAEKPVDYLAALLSRPPPASPPSGAKMAELLSAVETHPPSAEAFEQNLARALEHIERRLSVGLAPEDRAAIRSVYHEFYSRQLELKFQSYGRPSMSHHPTLRGLLLARSPSGREGSFLASEEDYRFVRDLHLRGRVVPVVGDFAGPRALQAISDFLRARGETVGAFYVSNVEFYLLRNGQFGRYVSNVEALPVTDESVFIRSYFDYGFPHPEGRFGERSTTILQRIPSFLSLYRSGRYRTYFDVATVDYVK